jgi:uncharacterized protein YggE
LQTHPRSGRPAPPDPARGSEDLAFDSIDGFGYHELMGMFRLATTILCSLSFALFSTSTAAAEPRKQESRIVVMGSAEIRATPDRAFITIAIETRNPNPRKAQEENAGISRAVLASLDKLGSEGTTIRTLSYGLNEEFDFDKGTRRSRGYLASNRIEVRLDDVERIGQVIGLATGAGATSIAELRFDVQDRDRLERKALRRAVVNGRARADAAAAGAGGRLGRLVEIEQAGLASPPGPPVFRRGLEMAADVGAPPIEAGEIVLRASVKVTALLEPAAPTSEP